ncbi:MAG: insulinase family protein [Tissierellales bacterium]|nr:insulinase family protein [Tissierellales bacterium]MBN2828308.1 insulinase family protein [Tissierellales bacterium]
MIHKIILDNGLRIIFEEVKYVSSVTAGIWVGAGSMYETQENNGISHLIEHMMFKGTQKRTAANIAEEIDSMGGQINAFTTKECTCYYTKATSDFFEKSLEILSDMMFNSVFDEEELRKEKKVILEEIFMYDDSPEDYVHELLTKIAFQGNSIAYPILGDSASIELIDRHKIIEYINDYYTADNIVLSIVGNVDKDVVKGLCEKYFAGFKKTGRKNIFEIKPTFNDIKQGVHKNIEQFHFCIGMKGFERNNENYHTSNILNNIIGGSMSSRLFQNVREKKGLVYSIYSFNSSYKLAGLFGIYSALQEDSLQEVMDIIMHEISQLKQGDISKEEFERSKAQLKGNYILSLENTSNRMTVLGRRELFYNEAVNPEDIVEKIENVSYTNVVDLSKELFSTNIFNIAYTGNLEKNKKISDVFK